MKNDVYMIMKKYAGMMAELEYSVGENPQIMIKGDGYCYATIPGADFANLGENDVIEYTLGQGHGFDIEAEFLMEQEERQALVISNTPYCRECRVLGKVVEATLDDMAQIVGQKVRIVDYTQPQVKRALKHAEGCFVKNKYTITVGRNPFEAVTALTVLEKSAEVFTKAEKIGGGVKIPKIEAKLMRLIYKKKYSKAEEQVKEAEVKGL